MEFGYKINEETSHTVSIDLDTLKHWEFCYKEKIYKLNVEEVLRLLQIVKGGGE